MKMLCGLKTGVYAVVSHTRVVDSTPAHQDQDRTVGNVLLII